MPAPDRPVTSTTGRAPGICGVGCPSLMHPSGFEGARLLLHAAERGIEREAEPGDGGGGEGIQLDRRQGDPGCGPALGLRQPDDLGARHQPGDQPQRRRGGHREVAEDAKAPHFQHPVQRRRRRDAQRPGLGRQRHLVVGDQPPAPIDQAQHEIGLSGPRRAEQQHGFPLTGD